MQEQSKSPDMQAEVVCTITTGGEGDQDSEAAADVLLHGSHLNGTRIYTERRLRERMARELRLLPEAPTEGLRPYVCDYLLGKHLRSVCDRAGLVGLQRQMYLLYKWGLNGPEIASLTGVSRQMANVYLFNARRRVRLRRPDRYEGLHEVYWQEVNRYVYRKRRR